MKQNKPRNDINNRGTKFINKRKKQLKQHKRHIGNPEKNRVSECIANQTKQTNELHQQSRTDYTQPRRAKWPRLSQIMCPGVWRVECVYVEDSMPNWVFLFLPFTFTCSVFTDLAWKSVGSGFTTPAERLGNALSNKAWVLSRDHRHLQNML